MQEFEDFRVIKGIRNTYVIEKRYIYVSFANWRRKLHWKPIQCFSKQFQI